MKCERCENTHNGTYGSGRFCNQKCARSFSTSKNRKSINKKMSKSIKRGYATGRTITQGAFKCGKENFQYKSKGGYRQNYENRLKTFDKFKGICQGCDKKLKKYRKHGWCAHHTELKLTKEDYHDTDKRILYCFPCHQKEHMKGINGKKIQQI